MNKKVLIVFAIVLVVIVLYASVQKGSGETPVTTGDGFLDEVVKWVKGKEGGVSKDPDDGAASNAWPDGSHTNRGITKTTFERYASVCGYNATYVVFTAMTPSTWLCIFRQYIAMGQSFSSNQVLATYMALWYWGGWNQTYMPASTVRSVISSGMAGKDILQELVEMRKKYFENLAVAKPSYQQYVAGWKKRADSFYSTFNKYI